MSKINVAVSALAKDSEDTVGNATIAEFGLVKLDAPSLSTSEAIAAPGGFGLGKQGAHLDTIRNDLLLPGFYSVNTGGSAPTTGLPFEWGAGAGVALVETYNTPGTQIITLTQINTLRQWKKRLGTGINDFWTEMANVLDGVPVAGFENKAAPGGYGWGSWSSRRFIMGTNLDTLKFVGSYSVNEPVNGPYGASGWWSIWVPASFSDSNGFGIQYTRRISAADVNVYVRTFISGTFGNWMKTPSFLDGVSVNGSAAPGGYGLGAVTAFSITDCNLAIYPGWYGYRVETVLNAPVRTHGMLLVMRGGHHVSHAIRQLAFNRDTAEIWHRRSLDSGANWSEWMSLPSGVSNSINAVSRTDAASSLAVKTAYDLAAEAKICSQSVFKSVTPNQYCGLSCTFGDGGISSQISLSVNVDGFTRKALQVYTHNSGRMVVYPNVDNVASLGTTVERWKDFYCASATIITSDEREKELINIDGSISNELIDVWSKINFSQFKYTHAISNKGNSVARIHIGIIAQRIKEAFESEGLDPFKYGLLCYDEWEACDAQTETYTEEIEPAEYKDVEVEISPESFNEETGEIIEAVITIESVLVKEAVTEEKTRVLQPAKEDGNRYALRYEECLCLEAAYQRHKAKQLETAVLSLTERVAKLEELLNAVI